MSGVLTVREGDHQWAMYDTGQHIGRIIAMSGGPYEVSVLRHMAQAYAHAALAYDGQPLVVDVGAHVGNHALYMAAVCDAPVVAVEPIDGNYSALVANLALNPYLTSLVRPCDVALGARRGRATYGTAAPDDITWGKAPARPAADDANAECELWTLDGLLVHVQCEDVPVALVKIDVEGMEPDVIAGAEDTLARCRPVVYAEARDDDAAAANTAALRPHRYRLSAVLNRRRTPMQVWVPDR